MTALCYALKCIEPEIFVTRVATMVRLAGCLLSKLDPRVVSLTRETYNSHRFVLFALCHIFILIEQVAPGQFNTQHEKGVFNTVRQRLQEIKDNQSCYRLYFEAEFADQILCHLAIEPVHDVPFLFRRLMLKCVGCGYLLHGISGAASFDIDIDAVKQGYESLREAAGRSDVERKPWFRELVGLDVLILLASRQSVCVEDLSRHYKQLLAVQQ